MKYDDRAAACAIVNENEKNARELNNEPFSMSFCIFRKHFQNDEDMIQAIQAAIDSNNSNLVPEPNAIRQRIRLGHWQDRATSSKQLISNKFLKSWPLQTRTSVTVVSSLILTDLALPEEGTQMQISKEG